MKNKVAVDTNVLIYLHDKFNETKRSVANDILAGSPAISTQVISEYLNTVRRILEIPKENVLRQSAELFVECEIIPVMPDTLLLAADLINRYQFQLFDAIIVAAALENDCNILYSEDMHHGLVVKDSLTILNPFSSIPNSGRSVIPGNRKG